MKTRYPVDYQKKIRIKRPRVDTRIKRTAKQSEVLDGLHTYTANMGPSQRKRWLSKAEVYVRAFLSDGLDREEIMERLRIDERTYDVIERAIMETHGARFCKMSNAHRYYLFSLRMEGLARQLDEFVDRHIDEDPRKSNVVGAIKAKKEIFNDVVRVGQELGVIKQQPKALRMYGDINLAVMPNDQLTVLVKDQMERFSTIVQNVPQLPAAFDRMLSNVTNDEEESDSRNTIDADYEEVQTA